jgi:hypothetical protein
LNVLKGEQLSAVVFVQNYLQLQFDGPVLTAFVWPSIEVAGKREHFGTASYRNILCGQISKVVRDVRDGPTELSVVFEDTSSINISLDPKFQTGPEIAMLWVDGRCWNVWR